MSKQHVDLNPTGRGKRNLVEIEEVGRVTPSAGVIVSVVVFGILVYYVLASCGALI